MVSRRNLRVDHSQSAPRYQLEKRCILGTAESSYMFMKIINLYLYGIVCHFSQVENFVPKRSKNGIHRFCSRFRHRQNNIWWISRIFTRHLNFLFTKWLKLLLLIHFFLDWQIKGRKASQSIFTHCVSINEYKIVRWINAACYWNLFFTKIILLKFY